MKMATTTITSVTVLLIPSLILLLSSLPKNNAFILSPKSTLIQTLKSKSSSQLYSSTPLGPRIPINESYPNLQKIYSNPDIYIIPYFLTPTSCTDLITRAQSKTLNQSPVAYAGWTTDFKDLVELAAKGPVAWFAILGAWVQTKDDAGASQFDLVSHMVQNFAILLILAVVGIALFTKSRADGLQKLRTSTSTTLDELNEEESGTTQFVKNAALLFGVNENDHKVPHSTAAKLFEAPTVIRYESGQVLAPHYDANRSAETEDANRGGQTLATLLVYLNDVEEGGLTRFGKLPAVSSSFSNEEEETSLTIKPKMGDALLFFPADANGNFDERTEHEGCVAVDEKWIARIWRHMDRVPPPFGLSEDALAHL